MAAHGTLGEFNYSKEDWTSYAERLELYFTANDVSTAAKQQAILLSVCGAETYQLIRDLVAPKKPTEHTFAKLVKLVKDHHQPPPSTIVQRFNFNTRIQKEGETVSDFVAGLRRLSEHCKFAATLNDMLRDRLVCGIRDRRLQQRLLAETDLTFKKALEISQAIEAAERNAKDLQTKLTLTSKPILAVNQPRGDQDHLTTKSSVTDVEVHTNLKNVHSRMQSVTIAKRKGTSLKCVVPRLGMEERKRLTKLTKSLRTATQMDYKIVPTLCIRRLQRTLTRSLLQLQQMKQS